MTRLLRALALVQLFLVLATGAHAHALQPGFLELEAQSATLWRVTWRVPDVSGTAMALALTLPDGCTPNTPPALHFDGVAHVAVWRASCPDGIAGGTLTVSGLEATQTDILLRYQLTPGQTGTLRLTPAENTATLPIVPDRFDVLRSYITLGIHHILSGTDHLLFVFALLLLVPNLRRLIGAITAFTLAHSLSLIAATLGWITVPVPPVEAVIALSIMFLAAELAQPPTHAASLVTRRPALAAFAFGLLHGLGFASALAEVGLPQGEIPLALFSFNLGVEVGQLLFVAVILSTALLLRRLSPPLFTALATPGRPGRRLLAYAIGTTSAIWLLLRLTAF